MDAYVSLGVWLRKMGMKFGICLCQFRCRAQKDWNEVSICLCQFRCRTERWNKVLHIFASVGMSKMGVRFNICFAYVHPMHSP